MYVRAPAPGWVLLRVEDRIAAKIGWGIGLIRGDDLDKLILAHRLKCVIVLTLNPNRRNGLGAQILTAPGACPVRRIDQRFIRKAEQLSMQRVVKHASQFGCRPAQGGAQVGTSDISDEKSVSRQNRREVGAARFQFVDQD